MAGKIDIDKERCKGCGLCVEACPQGLIRIAAASNRMGYFFAEPCGTGCTGCAICALMCPDLAIEVYRDGGQVQAAPQTPPSKLIKEPS